MIEQWTNYLNPEIEHEKCLMQEFMKGQRPEDIHKPIGISCPCKRCSPSC